MHTPLSQIPHFASAVAPLHAAPLALFALLLLNPVPVNSHIYGESTYYRKHGGAAYLDGRHISFFEDRISPCRCTRPAQTARFFALSQAVSLARTSGPFGPAPHCLLLRRHTAALQ